MDNIYEYKCEHCGGTVVHDDAKNIWVCEYCKTEFTNLYQNDGKDLAGAKDLRKINFYTCSSCGNSFYSLEVLNSCYKCNGPLDREEDEISGVVSSVIDFIPAKIKMKSALAPYASMFNINLDSIDIKDKYIKCDAITGSLVISNNSKSVEYIFLNVLYPYLKTDNYKIIYDFANEGYNSLSNVDTIDRIKNIPLSKEDKEIISQGDTVKQKIIEYCKNCFISQYGNAKVNIEDSLKIRKNILLKTYYYSFNYQGKEYISYYLSNHNRMQSNGSGRASKGIISLDVPKRNDVNKMDIKRKGAFSIVFGLITFVSIFGLFAIFFMNMFASSGNKDMLFAIFGVLAFISLILALSFNKSKEKISNQMIVSEELFLKNLINNSTYVKKIEGGK